MYKWLFYLLLFPTFCKAQNLPILPKPQKVLLKKGQFDFSATIDIEYNQEVKKEIKAHDILKELIKTRKKTKGTGQNIIWLGIIQEDKKLQSFCKKNKLDNKIIGKEGYHLIIRPQKIILAANSEAGLLYATYSLKQLLLSQAPQSFVPCLQITDFPNFRHRAIMDDISRGPLSNMNFLKEQIRRLSELKINQFSFYIEHVIKTKSHPNFAPEDGITIQEFKELSAYAKDYNIELIGSFQSLGHFRNILNAPDYRHLGASDRMLKPAANQSLQFLKEVYNEMLPAFSSDYFNINADEAWDLVRGDSKPLADSLGAGLLFSKHVNPLLQYLLAKEKRAMMWGDMLLSYPTAFDYIPKETTILTWEYSAYDSFSDWIEPIKKRGFDFWVCPGILNSLRIMPDYEVTYANLQNFINEGYEAGAKGVMTTIWDDGGGHFFSKDWLGVAYAASQSWQPERGNIANFEESFSQIYYNDSKNLLTQSIRTLNQLKKIKSTQKLSTAFFEAQLLADFGQVHQLNAKDLNAIQSIINQADSLLNILEKTPKEALNSEWTKDIYFWQFFIQHLKLHIKTYSQLLQLSEDYKTARDLKNKKNKLYKHQLNQILHTTKDLLKDWQDLKITYQALWLKENRYHWMKEATAVFENKIQDLASLSTLLQYVNQLPNAAPLPPAATIKLDITANQKDYFTFWLLSPPHPLQKGQSMQDDFLDDLGGEHQARPTPYDWKKFQSPYSYKVPLDKIAPIQKNSIIHAYCRIESPKEQSIKFVLNAPASSLILNGEQLNRQDNESTMLLKKGKNHLILKMYYSGQKKAFSFHLPDVKVVNRKQKYTIVEMKK